MIHLLITVAVLAVLTVNAWAQEVWVPKGVTGIVVVVTKAEVLSQQSREIGGTEILEGGRCLSDTLLVPGARNTMVVLVSPVNSLADVVMWHGYVSSPDWVTVKICSLVAVVPGVSRFNIRVIQ